MDRRPAGWACTLRFRPKAAYDLSVETSIYLNPAVTGQGMDRVIPWPRLLELIEPYYHGGETGRQPHELERMLRIYFLQQWFSLSDPQAEDAIYDSESMRRFAGWSWGRTRFRTSRRSRFRHLLEKHQLTEGSSSKQGAKLNTGNLGGTVGTRAQALRPGPETGGYCMSALIAV